MNRYETPEVGAFLRVVDVTPEEVDCWAHYFGIEVPNDPTFKVVRVESKEGSLCDTVAIKPLVNGVVPEGCSEMTFSTGSVLQEKMLPVLAD